MKLECKFLSLIWFWCTTKNAFLLFMIISLGWFMSSYEESLIGSSDRNFYNNQINNLASEQTHKTFRLKDALNLTQIFKKSFKFC